MKATIVLLSLTLAACGGATTQSEQTADRLENAAAQSDPASAAKLENAADAVRAGGGDASASAPGSIAQETLASAGERAVAAPRAAGPAAPPPKQAQPNRDGQIGPRPAVVPPNARD